jgi:uncharacterized pyridoxamine 5'-phosphate oxidase family protein
MITVSIFPVFKYCNIHKSSEQEAYSISQLVALCKNSIEAKKEMRLYLDKIKEKCQYLLKILEVLSMLSIERDIPDDISHNIEQKLFNDVLVFIKNNSRYFLSNNSERHDIFVKNCPVLKNLFSEYENLVILYNENLITNSIEHIKEKSRIFEDEYHKYRKEIKEIKTKKTIDQNQLEYEIARDSMIDIFIFAIEKWQDDFYSEIKKFCNILDNKDFIFALNNKYTYLFGPVLACSGDKEQKKIMDDCKDEFIELISEINKIVIETQQNIDYRKALFKKYPSLQQYFEALKTIQNEKCVFYITDTENNTFKWDGTKELLVALMMKLVKEESRRADFWKPFEMAFNLDKLWDSAKQYLKKKNGMENKNDKEADEIIIELNEYIKKVGSKKPKTSSF